MAGKVDYLVPVGLFKKTRKFILGHYSLTKIISELLNRLNVPFHDVCCDAQADSVPVRFNPTSGKLEHFNTSTETWVPVLTGSLT